MAKAKKSVENDEKEKEKEITNVVTDTKEVAANSGLGISYKGIITVSLKNGTRTLSKKKYHNIGRKPLFKFMCEALSGYFNKDLRPSRIRCFAKEGDTYVSVTPLITYETVATTKSDFETKDEYCVIYTFKIPYAFISGTIDTVRLYPTKYDSNDDICAEFEFEDPIEFTESDFNKGNYCIVLEWQMIISNKQDTTTNGGNN